MRFMFFFFTIILPFCLCSANTQEDQDKYDYSGLGMIVEAYYGEYFEYPKNVGNLISFVEVAEFPEIFDKTIEKLKNNRNKIVLKNKKNTLFTLEDSLIYKPALIITLEDSLIYKTALRSPCDELAYNLKFYLRKILLFDRDSCRIYNDDLERLFKKELTELKNNYSKGKKQSNRYEHTDKDYVFVKYSKENGIVFPCRKSSDLKEYKFIHDLEYLLEEFTKKHDIQKMIFMTQIGIE